VPQTILIAGVPHRKKRRSSEVGEVTLALCPSPQSLSYPTASIASRVFLPSPSLILRARVANVLDSSCLTSAGGDTLDHLWRSLII